VIPARPLGEDERAKYPSKTFVRTQEVNRRAQGRVKFCGFGCNRKSGYR
jgi:hypothetical protein